LKWSSHWWDSEQYICHFQKKWCALSKELMCPKMRAAPAGGRWKIQKNCVGFRYSTTLNPLLWHIYSLCLCLSLSLSLSLPYLRLKLSLKSYLPNHTSTKPQKAKVFAVYICVKFCVFVCVWLCWCVGVCVCVCVYNYVCVCVCDCVGV
jgi:hypothetical protein